MALKEKLEEIKAGFKEQADPEVIEKMNQATREVREQGLTSQVLKAGERAPEFTLESTGGAPITLTGLLALGPLVLTFYRGVW